MDAYRRIYLDGRKMPADFDPSYNGYSTGRWEGDTLVVETVNLRGETELDRYGSPHSDQLRIVERIRLVEPNILEDVLTMTDTVAFTKPWTQTRRYRRTDEGKRRAAREHVRRRAQACQEIGMLIRLCVAI